MHEDGVAVVEARAIGNFQSGGGDKQESLVSDVVAAVIDQGKTNSINLSKR